MHPAKDACRCRIVRHHAAHAAARAQGLDFDSCTLPSEKCCRPAFIFPERDGGSSMTSDAYSALSVNRAKLEIFHGPSHPGKKCVDPRWPLPPDAGRCPT